MNLIYTDNGTYSEGTASTVMLAADPPAEQPYTLRDITAGAQQISQTVQVVAAAAGQVVGSIQGAAKQGEINYQNARISAQTPTLKSRLTNWWLTSSDTDKMTVGIGVIGLALAALVAFKGK